MNDDKGSSRKNQEPRNATPGQNLLLGMVFTIAVLLVGLWVFQEMFQHEIHYSDFLQLVENSKFKADVVNKPRKSVTRCDRRNPRSPL